MLAEALEELTQLLEYSLAPVRLVLAAAALVEQAQEARLVLQIQAVGVAVLVILMQADSLAAQAAPA
jgi:hypothetical protein